MSSKDDKKRHSVPKFTSFKPKAVDTARVGSSTDPVGSGATKRLDDASLSTERKEKDRPLSPRLGEHGRDKKPAHEPVPFDRKRGTAHPGDDLFVVDKRGDPLILRYGSNERSLIPSYRRFGGGKILGASGWLALSREGLREEFTIRQSSERGSAFRDKNLLSALASKASSRRIKSLTKQSVPDDGEDFIALGSSRKRKRGQEDTEEASDRDALSFRSINTRPKDHDSDLETDSDTSDADGGLYYLTPARQRSASLTQRVKDHPEDTQAWLDLIDLQDELLRESEDENHVRSKDELRGLASLRLSLFEKALAHTPTGSGREQLLVRLMREGSRVWSSQALSAKWLEVAQENPHSFALWRARIDFELTNLATFSYDRMKELFVDRLRYLADSLASPSPPLDAANVASQAIYVFLRLTRFLHDSGFVDVAVGAWQAMLELHFARPVLEHDDRATALSALGDFWENEAARIGEAGAKGWNRSIGSDTDIPDPPHSKPSVTAELPGTRDGFKAWAITEKQRASEARMPARITDEGNESDPYRVVMLSDVEPFLFFFPMSIAPSIRSQLVDAFLLFCGLPPALTTDGLLPSALNDPFVFNRSRDLQGDLEQELPRSEDGGRQQPQFRQEGARMALSPDVLFPGPSWFSYLPSWKTLYPQGDEAVAPSFVLNTLRQLARSFGLEDLGEYCLAMEYLNEPESARKAARIIIRLYPSNARLYNAYALVELANGNLDVAERVFASATGPSMSSAGSAGQLLWNTWAWAELQRGRQELAVARLCASVDGHKLDSPVSPTLLLKTKLHLSGQRDNCLSLGAYEDASVFAVSVALLEYLTSGDAENSSSRAQGDILSALRRVEEFSDELSSRNMGASVERERFLQFAAKLLFYHATNGPFRPAFLREHFEKFVCLFPQNTIFLTLFSWAESSFRVDDPVRRLLRRTVLSEPHNCVSNRVFAIRHELRFGNVHSVRNAFEAALTSEACRGCAQLWIYYIRFCRLRRDVLGSGKDRDVAKKVFYRAVAACPASKELYMEAFTTLARDMSSAELTAVFNTISAKALRVHVDLDEFMQQWEERRGKTQLGNDG
ncbi:hypothetical protein VTK73DRAFT_667 [Phialemonium thermophilum]|uniref:DUF1740-domain-containing protein n=1 Tax=Phialemonium thermophilum TaxID=223376 RepID=A0ABR3XDC5_9PEZI